MAAAAPMNKITNVVLLALVGAISGGGTAHLTDTKGERIAALEAQAEDTKTGLHRIEERLDTIYELLLKKR